METNIDNTIEIRTLEDVEELTYLAKLDKHDLVATAQTIYFTPSNICINNYKLLELDSYLFSTLEEGKKLFIRGDDTDDAVLCTDNHTYSLVDIETSNSLLIVNNLQFFDHIKEHLQSNLLKAEVFAIHYNYLEPVPCKPHINKLYKLLTKCMYRGSEYESYINQDDLYSFEELLSNVQTSEEEMKEMLNTLPVVKLNGKICLVEFEYLFSVLSLMLKLIDENSWSLDEIDYEETINSLNHIVSKDILCSLFEKYTTESKVIDRLQLYKYKEEEICKIFAQVLLLHTGKFNLNEFLQVWQDSVPEGMIPKEEMLTGIALIDRKTNPPSIRSFLEENLPQDIHERFKVLFEAKEKWTVHEIAPYIQPFTSAKTDVNAILAKSARISTVNGIKYYSSKHAK